MKKNLEDAIARWRNNRKEKETRSVNIQQSQPLVGEFEIDIRIAQQVPEMYPGDINSLLIRIKTTTQSVVGEIVPDADVLLFEQAVNKLENDFYKRNSAINERPALQASSGEQVVSNPY